MPSPPDNPRPQRSEEEEAPTTEPTATSSQGPVPTRSPLDNPRLRPFFEQPLEEITRDLEGARRSKEEKEAAASRFPSASCRHSTVSGAHAPELEAERDERARQFVAEHHKKVADLAKYGYPNMREDQKEPRTVSDSQFTVGRADNSNIPPPFDSSTRRGPKVVDMQLVDSFAWRGERVARS